MPKVFVTFVLVKKVLFTFDSVSIILLKKFEILMLWNFLVIKISIRVLRQSWRNPPIKRTSIKSFCLKNLSKSMKDAFGLFKRIVLTSFGLFRYQKSFKKLKNEKKKLNHSRIYRRFWLQTGFLQKEPFWSIFTISKFSKPENFVIFGFSSKFFFSELQNYFCSTKNNFGPEAQKFAKILTCFFFFFFFFGGGGWKIDLIPPPPQKKNSGFRQDCRKTLINQIWIS